jgi:RHS repeat-associated protein
VDAAGDLLITDTGDDLVREVSAGVITTVAGGGEDGYGEGGPATAAELDQPQGVAVDPAGNIFITDYDFDTVREVVNSTGDIVTVAGAYHNWGYSGDGGPATAAALNSPSDVTVDANGNLIVVDSSNNVVREIGSVAAVNTAVYLTASANSTVVDDSVTLTATVSPPYLGGNLLAGDTVDFYDGDSLLGSDTIDASGQATYTTSDLSLGVHTITAQFLGDDYHAPSSGSITETIVNPSSTSLSESVEGSAVTLTATVSGEEEGTPTGDVEFLDGTTVLGYSHLSSGTAAFTTSYLTAGDHTDITAVYQGDSNFISSTSSAVSYDVLPIVTPTLTSSTSEIVSGSSQTVTLTASVPSTASGSVTFMDGVTSLGSPATLYNTATSTDALLLDGADGGINTDLPAPSDDIMTISAWVRIDGWTDSGGIVDAFDTGGFWPGVGYSPGGDWYVQSGNSNRDTGIPAQLADPAEGNGGWNHISVVFTSSNILFYYDSLPAVSFGYPPGWDSFGGSSTADLTIGDDGYEGGSQYVDAAIQEVDVWSTDLTAAEERQLYNHGVVLTSTYPESDSLAAVYHLNDSTADALGGDAYPGTPFGTYSWTTATPDLSVATLTVNTNDTSPSLSAGSNSITAVYGGETDVFGGGTSAVLPITVVGTTLPSSSPDDTTAVDDVPSQATPSPLTDGSLVLSLDDAGLTYVSGSNGQPIISLDNSSDYPIESSDDDYYLTGVTAALSIGGHDATTYYSQDDLTGSLGDGVYRFAVQVPDSLTTGNYSWSITITQTFGDDAAELSHTYTGTQNVLNWNSSPFGAGWMLDGLDQLAINDDNALLVQSDGTMAYFAYSDGSYTSPAGPFAFSTLTHSDSQYQLVGTDGTMETFNSSGNLVSVTDNDGNITSYSYYTSGASSGLLEYITDPSHHTTTFTYTSEYDSELLTTIEDFAGRDTSLTYNDYCQLVQVTDPDPDAEGETQPVSNFSYASSTGPLASYIDANGNPTLYAYRPDGTLQTVTSADGSTVTYQAAQALLFGSGDDGAPGSSDNLAYLVPSTTVRGVETDEAGAPTVYTFDTFGDATSVEDALGNITVSEFNCNGLVTETIAPSVINDGSPANPTTDFTYNTCTDELSSETAPDGSTQSWTYATYMTPGGPDEVVTLYTDGRGNETAYSYDGTDVEDVLTGTADLLSSEQYANGTSANNEGQDMTADGSDPITTYVYTQYSDGDEAPPAGLVLSTTDPDGDITASTYDAAGNPTATYQGQTISSDGYDPRYSAATWTFSNLALNAGRTFEIYASSSIGSDSDSADQTVGSGSPSSVSIGGSGGGAPASTLGSGWVDLGKVTLSAGATTLAVNLTGDMLLGQICIMQQTSSTVYNGADDPVSQADAMNNVTATTYDKLDRPIATSQGQSVALASDYAVFNNVPQSPGLTRTFDVYVNAATSNYHTTVTDSESGSTTFSYSGSSTTPLGSGWYLLGTIALAADDMSSIVTVEYTGGSVTQVTLLEQTGSAYYDPMGDVLSETDGLGRVTTLQYNELEEQVGASQGQFAPVENVADSYTATFNNLPQSPGQERTFQVYVDSAPDPITAAYNDYGVTENGTGTPLYQFSGSTTTPLGSGWYDFGTIILTGSDASTSLTLSGLTDGESQVCLVQADSAASYTATGMVASQTDGDGNVTSYAYNPLGEESSETAPAPNVGETTAQPVTTYIYDSLGRETSETDPLGHVTAYAYGYGTFDDTAIDEGIPSDSVATWQGQTLPQDSTSTDDSQTWTFSNLALNGDRSYEIFVQASSTADYSASDAYTAGLDETLSLDGSSSQYLSETALGSGWLLLGTVTLSSDDTSTTITVSHDDGASTANVCLMQWVDVDTDDADGNLVSETDALGNTTSYIYNALDLPQQQSVDDGPELGPIYDKAGYVVSDTDLQHGYATVYVMNMFGQTAETIQPNNVQDSGYYGEAVSDGVAVGAVTVDAYNADGELVSQSLPDPANGSQDSSSPTTTFTYDFLGDQVSASLPVPTTGAAGGPTSYSTYDLDGEQVGATDASDNVTAYAYDAFGNEISQSLPDPANGSQDSNSPLTTFTYDADGNVLSLTDPVGNTTAWTYNGAGQVASQSEVVALGYNPDGSIDTTTANYSYQYDLDNNLVQSTDADGHVIQGAYDYMNNEVGETWYPTAADAVAGTGSDGGESFAYDAAGNVREASNSIVLGDTSSTVADYTYQYDVVGNVTTEDVNLGGLSPAVALGSTYDFNDNRLTLSATIGETADFKNTYTYDALGYMTSIQQVAQSVDGANSVQCKYVTMSYDADSRLKEVDLYQSSGTSSLVASAAYTYDSDSNVTGLNYTTTIGGDDVLAGYSYSYDPANRATSMTYTSSTSAWDEEDTYAYDHDSQLTGTSYVVGDSSTSDSQSYDADGNRTSNLAPETAGTDTGAGNRMLFDGTYYYAYDANGSRTMRWIDNNGHPEGSPQAGDTDITVYGWNEKNQLTAVSTYATYSNYFSRASPTSQIEYNYDAFGNMVERTDAVADTSEYFIYDGQNIALILDASGGVIERELTGPVADQVFASEAGPDNTTGATAGTVNWYFTDAQGTVRDVARYSEDTSSVVDHVFYNSFGAVTSQTASAAGDQPTFYYNGTWRDPTTKLNLMGARWYDAVDSVFASYDPISFGGGQTNLSEFVGNSPTNRTDPSGMDWLSNSGSGASGQWGGNPGAPWYTRSNTGDPVADLLADLAALESAEAQFANTYLPPPYGQPPPPGGEPPAGSSPIDSNNIPPPYAPPPPPGGEPAAGFSPIDWNNFPPTSPPTPPPGSEPAPGSDPFSQWPLQSPSPSSPPVGNLLQFGVSGTGVPVIQSLMAKPPPQPLLPRINKSIFNDASPLLQNLFNQLTKPKPEPQPQDPLVYQNPNLDWSSGLNGWARVNFPLAPGVNIFGAVGDSPSLPHPNPFFDQHGTTPFSLGLEFKGP